MFRGPSTDRTGITLLVFGRLKVRVFGEDFSPGRTAFVNFYIRKTNTYEST